MQIRTPRTAILVVQLVCNAVSQALEAKKLELSFYCMDRPSTSHHQHTPASHGMHAMLTPVICPASARAYAPFRSNVHLCCVATS